MKSPAKITKTETLNEFLHNCNVQIGQAEKMHDYNFLNKVLSNNLNFYRADGSLVKKQQFLEQLQGRKYEIMKTEIQKITISEAQTEATVVAIVTARGKIQNEPFGGVFHNERSWKKEDNGQWKLVHWKNTRINS